MRIYLLIFAILSCLFLRTAMASTSQQFEFGTISGPCVDHSCVINFKNNYDDPLIFLMPSFADGHWNDAPSTLRVISANGGVGGKARIRQYFAPYNHNELTLLDPGQCNGANWCLTKQPMTNISYFVIENGADINLGSKGRIIAKSILTNKYLRYKQTASKYNSEEVKTQNLIGENQLENFGVIVESQAVNNISEQLPPNGIFENQYVIDNILGYPFHIKENYTNRWYTPAVIKNSNSFYLALDRGETVINGDYYNNYNYYQKVGYLLVTGSGQYKGLLFSLGHGSTPNTLGQNKDYKGFKNVTLPSERQCGEVTEVPHSSQFKGLPFILASKNSRNGSDGGIFRLCRLKQESRNSDDIEVSFVTDEDLNEPRRGKTNESCGGQDCIERRHADEKFGFMAFQQVVDAKTCELFPGPAQSWDKYNGNILIDGKSEIENTHLLDGKRYLGFPYNSIKGTNVFEGCDGKQCRSLPDLMPNKQKISDIPESDFNIIIRKDTIWRDGGTYNNVRFEGGETLTLYSGIYYFNSLLIGNNAKIYIPKGQNVRIYTHYFNMADNSEFESEDMTANGDLSGVVFVKNGGQQPSDMLNFVDFNKAEFKGYLYAEKMVHLSNGSEIEGAVTAQAVNLHNKSEIEGKLDGCFSPTPNYSLTITPKIKTNTLCDDQPITFNVQASDGSSSNYTGKIRVTISSRFGGQWAENANFTNAIKFSGNTSFDLDVANNQARFWLRANDAEKIMVSGSIDRMEGAAPIGEYSFIPGGFKITPQSANIIAGKPFSATITAVACPAKGKEKPISMYDGEKTLNFSTQYQSPKTGNVAVNILRDNSQLTTSATIRFNKGESEPLTLQYSDAGSLIWNVTDPNCTTESCLLTDGKTRQAQELKRLLPDGLKGSMTINSRPWTFAICPTQGKNIDGTALGGQPLAAAGDYFYLHVRPVVWQPGGSESDPISTTAYNLCNAAITPNFFKSDAPTLNVNISLNEKQPVSPVGGDYGQLSGNLQANNHTGNDYLNYRLTWSEVGSVPLKASGQSDYLGMPINPGYRSAGRIYPAFFGFTHNELTPAMGSFTYMGQPFPVHWVVNAFNRQGKAVGNYDKFASKLTAKFAFDIKNSGSNSENRLLLQQPLPQTWSHNGENHHSYMSYQSDVTFARQGFQALDKVTTPDGPYNSWQLWLTITNPNAGRPAQDPRRLTPELCNPNDGCSDPDLSKMTELRLGNTNPMRYGRMVLQDAAGDIRGPVAIPLRVEYWNGAAFETNTDDSGSHFDGRNYCRQILYPQPDKGNSPSTSGLGNVDQGVASNEKLVAYPDVPVLEPFKQQVRFWQRLSNSTEPKGNGISCRGTYTYQPWLSYNWRKKGDEDPSAIVTFGVYQGNKRIIYRAEAGVASSNYQ